MKVETYQKYVYPVKLIVRLVQQRDGSFCFTSGMSLLLTCF